MTSCENYRTIFRDFQGNIFLTVGIYIYFTIPKVKYNPHMQIWIFKWLSLEICVQGLIFHTYGRFFTMTIIDIKAR